MAVVNTVSTTLSNIVASPPVANPSTKQGRLRFKSETVAVAAADDDTSTFRFFRVKSSDSIKSLRLICTAITGGTDYDCGLYTIAGGAVVDADLYADGFSVATAAPAVPPTAAANGGIELRFGDASTAVPGDVNNRVWEDLGLTSDPNLEYDVVITANTVGTAAGTLTLIMEYSAGD